MKKLHLKTGSDFDVKITNLKANDSKDDVRELEMFDYNDDLLCTFRIIKGVLFIEMTARKLHLYEILAIAENAENFTQYFNNLNQ